MVNRLMMKAIVRNSPLSHQVGFFWKAAVVNNIGLAFFIFVLEDNETGFVTACPFGRMQEENSSRTARTTVAPKWLTWYPEYCRIPQTAPQKKGTLPSSPK